MNFDSSWMDDLHELQKRAAELGGNENPSNAALELAMDLLKKWGVDSIPWNNNFESLKSLWAKGNLYGGPNKNIDISERKQDVLVQMTIPGIKDQNDLSVSFANQTLYINAKSNAYEKEGGSFSREIRLPAAVTTEGATAAYRNHLLTVTLPKTAPQKGEKIPVSFLPAE